MSVDLQIMAERLKDLRITNRLTQAQLSTEADIERKSIIRYETGFNVPNGRNLVKLAEVLGVTTDYILGLADAPQPTTKSELPLDEVECVMALRMHPTPEAKARMVKMLEALVG